jgi:hypothetical protein
MGVLLSFLKNLTGNMMLICSLFFVVESHGQSSRDEKKFLMGRVVNPTNNAPLPNVHIINLRSAAGAFTSQDGSFIILAAATDRLLFQSVGFSSDTIQLNAQIFEEGYLIVELADRVYELPQVDVFPYPTFTDFKYAFLNKKVADDNVKISLPQLPNLVQPGEGFGLRIDGPITAMYNQFSRRGREIREYQNVLEREDLRRRASRVVNAEVVRRYTGLENDAEIEAFLKFCNMSDEFIVANQQYVVYEQLLACFQQYREVSSH